MEEQLNDRLPLRGVAVGTAIAWIVGGVFYAIVAGLRHVVHGFAGSPAETALLVTGSIVFNMGAGAVAADVTLKRRQSPATALAAGALTGVALAVSAVVFGIVTFHALELRGFHTDWSDLTDGCTTGALLGLAGAAVWRARLNRGSDRS